MEVSSSRLDFRLSLMDVNGLRPHEEIIDQAVRSLANEIRTEGEVRDPLIVDQDELVILDGMHRYSALKILKCRYAPCCLVDYDSPQIKVGAWYRLFNVSEAESLAERILNESDLAYSKIESKDEMDPRAVLLTNRCEFLLNKAMEPIECARTAVQLEKLVAKANHRVEYLSEMAAIQRLRSGGVNLVITVPVFSKQQIRRICQQQILLPHKTTRHIIPSRPLHVNVPLKMLIDPRLSQAKADRMLGDLLAKRQVDRKPPGSVVDGRKYEEELLDFAS